ncbi:DUF2752 domain-containing protein [Natronoflexus pectinivorans]|uniref:Uncharacterized protein DUF2752 n=1 Tax=Natronoflexus pectinivorans TaxID=682526 RepID=A0A4R2GL98_9BACT|nr:DUF2752 domain-containing protein [Natronoflexus pectinivorans]TCO09734.1 uncharacterized protein DUF2752 [Natronoflexus pectinivorans]
MISFRSILSYKAKYFEAATWLLALFLLAINNPTSHAHFSLCLLHNLDMGFCPGCGLGRSISWLFRGEIIKSIHSHPLGIPTMIILTHRIYTLLNNRY